MSKKTTDTPLISLSQDWNYDPVEGLPFGGAAIQSFIKTHLGKIPKASWFNSAESTVYYFASEEDRTAFIADTTNTLLVLFSTQITFDSVMYRLMVTNNNGSNNLSIATNESSLVLSMDFDCQSKEMGVQSWTSSGRGANVTVYADPGATGTFRVFKEETFYRAGSTVNINVRDILEAGTNRIKVQFTMEEDRSVSATVTYTIEMVEMYVELAQSSWALPIVETGDPNAYKLGGFRIVGSLNKTLHIKIYSNESELMHIQHVIGLDNYAAVPFFYTKDLHGLDLSELPTGVFLVAAYLTAGPTTSTSVQYNIMHIREEDILEAQLCCINEVSDLFYNYTTSVLFKYSIYNKNQNSGSPHVIIRALNGTTPTIMKNEPLDAVTTSEEHELTLSLEWLVEETLNLSISTIMTFGNEQVASIPVDNSATFPPVSGYSLYFNAASRGNSDSNKTSIVNLVSGNPTIPAIWTRMAWMNDIDGWTHDPDGRACLLIPAGSKMRVRYQDFRILSRDNISIELCYKVANVSDYDENIITIADDPTAPNFKGIRIKPTNITVHSSADSTADNDLSRGTNLKDEELIHLVVTIAADFKGLNQRNLVSGYVNGSKNFEFDYPSGAVWTQDADLVVGGDESDIYLYFMRVYPRVLSDDNVRANRVNSLGSLSARQDMAALLLSVMNSQRTNIDFQQVKNNNYNFFVIEMLEGAQIPAKANNWDKEQTALCNLEMHYGRHESWDWRISNIPVGGQGTTSMNYYWWNMRWKIKDAANGVAPVQYLISRNLVQGSYEYEWGVGSPSDSVIFDGNGNHPPVSTITAKINFASSMQSHKIGATRMYNDLHRALGLTNEALTHADQNELPKPTVAVYQYPVFGFRKEGNSYAFIGLFTIGPDKGDDSTFGFNLGTIPQDLISMEGTDHARRLVMFNTPWNNDVQFLASNKCLNVVIGQDNYDKGWEVGACKGLKPKKIEHQTAIQTHLETYFKPAYDLIYDNSTLILPIALDVYGADAAETLDYIQNHLSDFQASLSPDGRMSLVNYEFWIEGDYTLYHYDLKEREYVASVNLVTDLGAPPSSADTLEKENEWFKAQRKARFMASAENYWDITDALFHMAFLLFTGSMDNFGKNTYPYFMGSTWKWRQDDLDSLFGIGNAGADNMPTWMEFTDSKNGSLYFGGSNSVFWNLIYECYKENYTSTKTGLPAKGLISVGQDMIAEMVRKGAGANTLDSMMRYFKATFWDNGQEYFPETAYNVDADYKYETAWVNNGQDVPPLTQSLGNHYSAEKLWVYKRTIYMLSFFKAGAFSSSADSSLGQISFRPLNLPSLTLTPEDYLYPALSLGQGAEPTQRRLPGIGQTFEGPYGGDGQTTIYIQASNLLKSIGDFKDVKLAEGYVYAITITGKKLVSFKIGDETEPVSTNIPGLIFPNNYCLRIIDARNAAALSGEIDLSHCTRLREAHFNGTHVTQIAIARGQKIEKLSMSDYISSILLKNLTFLTDLMLPTDLSGIELIKINGCDSFNSFEVLEEVYRTHNNILKYISVEETHSSMLTESFLEVLIRINQNVDIDDQTVEYAGVNASDNPAPGAAPVIEGEFRVAGLHESKFTALNVTSEEVFETTLKRALIGLFNTGLYMIYNPDIIWLDFEDSLVEELCSATWGSDGHITLGQVESVTSLGTTFNGRGITKFNELGRFTGVTSIYGSTNSPYGAFANCTSLEEITLPDTVTAINASAFRGCSGLKKIVLPSGLKTIGNGAFYNCSQWAGDVIIPETVTTINAQAFQGCSSIKNLYLPCGCSNQALTDCGNGQGTLMMNGTLSRNYNATNVNKFKYVHLKAVSYTTGSSAGVSGGVTIVAMRIGGNISCSQSNCYMYYGGSGATAKLDFMEVLGTISSNMRLFYGNSATSIKNNAIVHLGYDTVTNDALPCGLASITGTASLSGISRISKIYVGKGLSQQEDTAILNKYLEDATWALVETKLDTWWNYLNDPDANPDYVISPFNQQ